ELLPESTPPSTALADGPPPVGDLPSPEIVPAPAQPPPSPIPAIGVALIADPRITRPETARTPSPSPIPLTSETPAWDDRFWISLVDFLWTDWPADGWKALVGAVWFGGSAYWLGLLVSRTWRLRRLLCFAQQAPDWLQGQTDQLA